MKRKIAGLFIFALVAFSVLSYAETPLVKLGLLVDAKGAQLEIKRITFGGLKELSAMKGSAEVKIPFYFIDYLEVEGYNRDALRVDAIVHFRDGLSERVQLWNEYFHGKSTLGEFYILAKDVSELHFPD